MLWLTTVNPTFNQGTLKKCWDLGWKGVGGKTMWKKSAYLWKNPGYALAKTRKNNKSLEKRRYHLSGVVFSRKRWSRIIHDGMKTPRSFQRKKRVTTVVSGRSVKCNAIFAVCDLSVLGFKTLLLVCSILPCGYLTFPIYGNMKLRYEQQTLTTLFCTLKSDFLDVKSFEF